MTNSQLLPDNTPLLLTVEQAARLASVSRSTVYSMLAAGIWPSIYVGGRSRRISRRWLEQWIDGQLAAWQRARGEKA